MKLKANILLKSYSKFLNFKPKVENPVNPVVEMLKKYQMTSIYKNVKNTYVWCLLKCGCIRSFGRGYQKYNISQQIS